MDGHDPEAIEAALTEAQNSDKPTMIAAKTTIGFGSPSKSGTNKVHGSPLGADEIAATREALGWSAEPFEVPSDILDAWRIAGLRSANARKEWEQRFNEANAELRGEFERRNRGDLPAGFDAAIDATRKSLQKPSQRLRPVRRHRLF